MGEIGEMGEIEIGEYVEIRPCVRGGQICFKGTRITVYDIAEYLDGGMSEDEVLLSFPKLTSEHLCVAREFSEKYGGHPLYGI